MLMKKGISVVLSTAMLMSGLSFSPDILSSMTVNAVGTLKVTVDNVTYRIQVTGDDTASLSSLVSTSESVLDLPSSVTVNGRTYTITDIAKNFCNTNYCVEEVTIPDTVTTIGKYAFGNTIFLEKVNGGENVSQVGYSAFNNSGWISDVREEQGYVLLGKVLMDYDATVLGNFDTNVVDLSSGVFSELESICPMALSRDAKHITTLYLPKNMTNIAPDGSKGMLGTGHSTVQDIYYFDAAYDDYRSLYDIVMSDERTDEENEFLMTHYSEFTESDFCDAVCFDLAQRIFDRLGIVGDGSRELGTLTPVEEYSIVRSLYFEIHLNAEYSYNADNDTKSSGFREDMVNHKGMLCAEYADLLNYLLGLAGVFSETVTGSNHAWNIVQIGGEWFNVDVCKSWYQPTTVMTTDDAIASIRSHTRNVASELLPACIIKMGDVNLDGILDEADADLANYAALCLLNGEDPGLNDFELVLCDVDRNGFIDENDANLILSYHDECQEGYTGFLENYMVQTETWSE